MSYVIFSCARLPNESMGLWIFEYMNAVVLLKARI